MTTLSALGILHRPRSPVDCYVADRCEVWIVHGAGCPRAMTADGLCACADPEAYVLAGEVRSKRKR